MEFWWSLKASLHTIETPLQTGVPRDLCGVWCLKQNCANWKYIIFFGALLVLKHVVIELAVNKIILKMLGNYKDKCYLCNGMCVVRGPIACVSESLLLNKT